MFLINFEEQFWTLSRYIASGLSFRQITFTSDVAGSEIHKNNKHYSNQTGIFSYFRKLKFWFARLVDYSALGIIIIIIIIIIIVCPLQLVRNLNTKHTQCGT